MTLKVALIDGSISKNGNTSILLSAFADCLRTLSPDVTIQTFVLAQLSPEEVLKGLEGSAGYVFATGTYWDGWGSPLQAFLESATKTEATPLWVGKPAAVLVSAHSVGAKGVLSRLQGVLNTYGCMIPPMSGWLYTAATQLALDHPAPSPRMIQLREDLWNLEDLNRVAFNLLSAIRITQSLLENPWKTWPVDRDSFQEHWVTLPEKPES